MIKKLDVVAAIIERDGKILLAQRPAHADQAGLWEFAGGKVEPGETQPQALVRELREELGIDATPGVYIASHQRDVSGRRIHLHAWHVPAFNGLIRALEHQALAWCTPEEALEYPLAPADIPLLQAFMALRDARLTDFRADGFFVTLALEQDAFHFYYRAFGVILILVNAALNAGLGRLTARAENFRRDIHLNIRTTVLVCQPDHWHYSHHGDHEASAHRSSLFF